jgi:uncharacterized membrane protein
MNTIYRNKTLDNLRGVAIIIMIMANSWPYVYPFDECPLFLRVLFSTAAPIFVYISGYVNGFQVKDITKRNSLKRPLQILVLAVLIDLFVWNIVPFVTFDVLYLIAISMIVLNYLRELNKNYFVLMTLGLLSFNTFLVNKYDFDFSEISLTNDLSDYNVINVLQHFLYDGWFPIFPWMGIFFLGYFISKYCRIKKVDLYLYVGLFFLCAYFISLNLKIQTVQPMRKGYTELFYPLTGIFWFYLVGILATITFFIKTNKYFNKELSLIGTFSLPVYIFHTLVISYILPFFSQEADKYLIYNTIFIMILFYFLIFIYVIILNKLRTKFRDGSLKYLGYILGV